MKRVFYFLLSSFVLFVSCNNGSPLNRQYRIQENGLYGFIDSLGNVVIGPQYKYVGNFAEDGYACVISDIRIEKDTSAFLALIDHDLTKDSILRITYGYINRDNELIIDTVNHISISYMGLADWGGMQTIKSAHKYIDNKLEFRSALLDVLSLCNGLFVFQDEKTKLFGYKDANGNVKIGAKYNNCHNFSNGVAVVSENKRGKDLDLSKTFNNCCVINTEGESIISGYTIIQDFRENGMTWALTTSIDFDKNDIKRDWVQIDKKGTIKMGPVTHNVSWVYNNDTYPICVIDGPFGSYYTFLDEKGDFLSDFNRDHMLNLDGNNKERGELFADVTRFSNGFVGIKGYNENGQSAWQFFDKNLMPQSEPYDTLLPFSEGLAAVKELTFIGDMSSHWGKWGFVRMEGGDSAIVQAIPYSFSECGSFNGGLAYFMNKGTTFDVEGYINRSGQVIWQTKRMRIK